MCLTKNLADVCRRECQLSKEALWVNQLNRPEKWLKPFLTAIPHRSVSSQWPDTMARHGVVYTNHSGTFHLPAHDVKVANTAGAGATFSAGLIFGRVQSWPDDETVAFANALAGLYCSGPSGISCFSATEVMEFAASRGLQLTS
jgi:hypothetical protein